jgi:hypothetical protein
MDAGPRRGDLLFGETKAGVSEVVLSEKSLLWLEGQVDKEIEGESRSIKEIRSGWQRPWGAVGKFLDEARWPQLHTSP